MDFVTYPTRVPVNMDIQERNVIPSLAQQIATITARAWAQINATATPDITVTIVAAPAPVALLQI